MSVISNDFAGALSMIRNEIIQLKAHQVQLETELIQTKRELNQLKNESYSNVDSSIARAIGLNDQDQLQAFSTQPLNTTQAEMVRGALQEHTEAPEINIDPTLLKAFQEHLRFNPVSRASTEIKYSQPATSYQAAHQALANNNLKAASERSQITKLQQPAPNNLRRRERNALMQITGRIQDFNIS